MNAILIIILIIGSLLLLIFVYQKSKRSAYISNIVTKYPILVSTLCRTNVGYLGTNVKSIIRSLPLEVWVDWNKKINELMSCSKSFPEVMSDYILYYFPSVKDTPHYKNFKIFDPAVNRCKILIYCLQYDDVLKLCQISREEWSIRNENKSQADAIILSNPDAIKELRKQDPSLMDEDIIRHRKRIGQIQKRHNVASAFDDWSKRQDEFCTVARNLRDNFAKNCGCYTYDIKFERPLGNGKTRSEVFKIWQIFSASMSPFHLEHQPESRVSLYNQLSEFKNKSRWYNQSAYDDVIPYIEAIGKDKSIVVLFNNHTSYDWNIDSYNFHYDYISGLLSENSIDWIDVEELNDNIEEFDYDIVFVFDFITVNSDLKYISKNIIESFSKKVPVMVWYSMIKEFDEHESYALCKDSISKEAEKKKEVEEKAKKERERATLLKDKSRGIDFIKSQLLAVNKHPFFSYYAITNTLIGEAANSSDVKAVWLSCPNKFWVKSTDKDHKKPGYISISYSIDGGLSWIALEKNAEYQNIDDVALFTYELFTVMGVLEEFIAKGDKAISYMNSHQYLAHR